MVSNNLGNSGESDFGVLLTITFIVLKLTGVIDWSWFWVLSPVWIAVILYAILIAVICKFDYRNWR